MMIYSRFMEYFAVFTFVIIVVSADLCEELPVIKNGQLLLNEGQNIPFRINDVLSYKCNKGYTTDELRPKVVCVFEDNVANWTQSACRPNIVSCNDPGFIENADRTGLVFNYPHKVEYACHEGYRMVGIPSKYCSITGVWQPSVNPYCEEVLCPVLVHPSNGEVMHSNRRLYSVAVFKCARYYKLIGESELECEADGTWSGKSPVCEKITCKAPDIPNGHIIGKNNTVYYASDIIIIRCNDGVTHSTSKCSENGEWTRPPPACPGSISSFNAGHSPLIPSEWKLGYGVAVQSLAAVFLLNI